MIPVRMKLGVPKSTAVLALLLVIAVQYIITMWSTRYGANEALVNQVSFAGTLTSIILAVLAIVYSYYQTFAQQRDAASVASQIDVLRQTIENMRLSEGTFATELTRLELISGKLDRSIALGEESSVTSRTMQEQLAALRAAIDAKELQASSPLPAAWDTKEVAEQLVSRATQVQLAIYCALLEASERGQPLEYAHKALVLPAAHARGVDYMDVYLQGFFTGLWQLLLDLGLLFIPEPDKFKIAPPFATLVRAAIDKAPAEPQGILDVPSVKRVIETTPERPL